MNLPVLPLTPYAITVIEGLKNRRALCLSFFHQEMSQFEVADAEATKAEAQAAMKKTKEAVAEATRKRALARNVYTLAQVHLNEHDGLGEIVFNLETLNTQVLNAT